MLHGFAALCVLVVLAGAGNASRMPAAYGDPETTQAIALAHLGEDQEPQVWEDRESGGKAGEEPAAAENAGNHASKPWRPAAKDTEPAAHAPRPARSKDQHAAHADWPAGKEELRIAHAGRPAADAGQYAAHTDWPASRSAQPAREAALVCDEKALGPGRDIPVDATGGPQFGMIQFKDTLPLSDKEVVFTFDDGPHPKRTAEILDILDRYCVKAVFFLIGEMAQRHPEMVREIDRRGHIIATHTWSHPLSLNFVSHESAEEQIEQGIAAVADALGRPPAPFFRFPGLGQSKKLLAFMTEHDIAVWSVDAIAGDAEGVSAARMPQRLMSRLKKYGRGILLFHDIKQTTVEALPVIMEELREEGYRAAHVVSKGPELTVPALTAKLKEHRRGGRQADFHHGRGKSRYR